MRRAFENRDDLIGYLKKAFPNAVQPDAVPETRGGREAALKTLHGTRLSQYQSTRNYLDGDVTMLSPYIRHGVLSLAEVRDYGLSADAPDKFINELGWRDYWQRKYAEIGGDVWTDLEPYKTGFSAETYAPTLPNDIISAQTNTCIDLFIRELYATGYLHNHARMWLAAYVVHWRRVRWQAGAKWFLQHLLDGDPASNNLSWQWVASTFSHKPYFMNADNIRRYAKGSYLQLLKQSLEPFEGSYPQLEATLFPNKPPESRQNQRGRKPPKRSRR